MRKLLLPLFLLVSYSGCCQSLLQARTDSYHTLIYKITNTEAEFLYSNKEDNPPSSYFHTLIDFFPSDSTYNKSLPVGHFLFVKSKAEELTVELQSVNNVEMRILNNSRDMLFILKNAKGEEQQELRPVLDGREIAFDRTYQAYRKAKTNRQGFVNVQVDDHLNIFSLARTYNNTLPARAKRRIITTFPFNHIYKTLLYVPKNVRSLIKYNHIEPPGIFFRVKRLFEERTFSGYMVLNKPQYKPGDTVRIKAFYTTQKGRPVNRKMQLTLSGYSGTKYITKRLGEVNAYRPGAYLFEFVLSDTLKLTLDQRYTVYLEDRGDNNFPSEDFQFSQYELKQNTYTLTIDSNQPENKGATLSLKGTDTNDLPLYNVQVEVIVKSKEVDVFYNKEAFVPDTLWRHQLKLDPLGETKVEIPDSVLAEVKMTYEVAAIFTNADNERQVKTQTVEFDHRFIEVKHELKADSLWISSPTLNGVCTLVSFNQKNEIIDSEPITLPYKIKIHQGISLYHLLLEKKVLKIIPITAEEDGLRVMAQRSKEDLTVIVQNDRKINFRYQLFKGKRIVEGGTTTELEFKRKTSPGEHYYLSLQYIWADQPREQDYELGFARKPLSISVDHPGTVFPGQTVDFKISVRDAFNKPVKKADLTAYAITRKFGPSSVASVPSFEHVKSRRAFNSFNEQSTKRQEIQERLDYTFWRKHLGLDSQAYYHFLYPEGGIFIQQVPARDSITQVAPYVVNNGFVEPVYYIYVGNQLKGYFDTKTIDPYSFRADSGKVDITLRLRDTLVTITKFPLAHGVKTILSIDLQNPPHDVTIEKQPVQFTETEAKNLRPHFIWINRQADQAKAYLQQGERYHLLRPIENSRSTVSDLVGPVFPGVANYQSSFGLDFYMRPMRNYTFEPGLIDRESANMNFYLSPYPLKPSFWDQVHTKKSIEAFWKTLDVNRPPVFRKYPDYKFNKATGSLYIKETQTHVARLATFILNLDNPDEYYIYPGNERHFTSLRQAHYQVVVIFADGGYMHPKPVFVKRNGRTFYSLENEPIKQADAFSEEVIKKIEWWSLKNNYVEQDRQKEMQQVREQYYTMATDYTQYSGGHWATGVLTSAEDNSPLPGVNVILKGTTTGTVTDLDGAYRIYIPANGVLVFSFIGIITEERAMGASTRMDVQLQSDVTQLNEVVVVGYGVQSKHYSTASAVRFEQAIMGRLAGVQISGAPGVADSITLRIRGVQSLSVSNTPLVIIDGKLMKMEDIDQSRVTAIEILSSEKATALYGARAANGIVLISTKPGITKSQLLEQKFPDIPQFSGVDESTPGSSLRKNFRDYAFWQPNLSTNIKGEATFSVTFPDDITGWNVHVFGMASAKRTGQTTSKIQSFKPLVAQLAIPHFLIAGDSSYALGKITNYSSDSLTVQKEVTLNGVSSSGEFNIKNSIIDSVLLLGDGDSVRIKYQIEHKKYLDGEQRKIPVFRAGVKEANGFFVALPKDTTFTLSFDKGKGDLSLYAEADLLDVLLDEIREVRAYPYECNEQLASKLKLMIAGKHIQTYRDEKFDQDKDIERIVRKLCANQTKEGGWSWWESGKSSPWITRHVAEALDAAIKSGYKVVYDRAGVLEFLSEVDHQRLTTEEQLKTFLFLGADKRVMAKALIDSLARKDKLNSVYVKLLAQRVLQVANEKVDWAWVEKEKRQTLKGNWYWGEERHSLWNNDVDNTLLVYQLMETRNSGDLNLYKLRNYFLEKRNRGWRNTYESARIVEILLPALLAQKKSDSKPSLTINGSSITEFPYSGEMTDVESLVVSKKGNTPVYFTAYQQKWNSTPEKVGNEFVVKTAWTDAPTKLTAGKPATLTVTLEVKEDAEYVMISIPIPAGCSYENKRQSRSQGEVYREYDLHETRIYCEKLKAGEYTYSIQLQPRYKGTYTLNPAKAEWMYFPVVYGREELRKIKID